MTVGNIVDRARARLGDTDKTGWNDTTLIDLVDQAQQDIAKGAQVYKRTAYFGLINNKVLGPLPEDCFQVNRVEYNDTPVNVLAREDQDIRAMRKGFHIIKNDIDMSVLEISEPFTDLCDYAEFEGGWYSREDTTTTVDALGVTTDVSDEVVEIPIAELGCITDAEFTDDNWDKFPTTYGDISDIATVADYARAGDHLGVLTDLNFGYSDGTTLGFLSSVGYADVVGIYGICTDALVPDNYLKIYYSALPGRVNSLWDALVVSDMWQRALVHYVVGMARQDDNDEGNYSLGIKEIEKYEKEMARAKKFAARSYNSPVSEVRETQYRRI